MTYTEPVHSDARFNLWITKGDCSKVIVYGTHEELADLLPAVLETPGLSGVYVLPDGEEPEPLALPVGWDREDDEGDCE